MIVKRPPVNCPLFIELTTSFDGYMIHKRCAAHMDRPSVLWTWHQVTFLFQNPIFPNAKYNQIRLNQTALTVWAALYNMLIPTVLGASPFSPDSADKKPMLIVTNWLSCHWIDNLKPTIGKCNAIYVHAIRCNWQVVLQYLHQYGGVMDRNCRMICVSLSACCNLTCILRNATTSLVS